MYIKFIRNKNVYILKKIQPNFIWTNIWCVLATMENKRLKFFIFGHTEKSRFHCFCKYYNVTL